MLTAHRITVASTNKELLAALECVVGHIAAHYRALEWDVFQQKNARRDVRSSAVKSWRFGC